MTGDNDLMDIAEICRRLGIQPVEIEAMEEEGLITLAAVRDGKALPSDQLDRITMILRLQRDLSVNLAGIDVILEMRSKMIQMRQEVDDILDFIRRQISQDLREMLGEEEYPMALGPGAGLYVTGTINGRATSNGQKQDFCTIKYDLQGNRRWVATYDGPGEGRDEVGDLAVDSMGRVYVTGASEGDAATILYSTPVHGGP